MKKQSFNYHTHTKRCGHANGDDEQYIRAAMMAGFDELGFSEHIPYPGIEKPGERMLHSDVQEYLESLTHFKKAVAKDIKISIGFEIEYFDEQLDYLKQMRTQCDYMILGQHCRYFDGCGYDYLSDDEDVIAYGEQVVKGMASGLVSMLAHPDYFMLGRRDFSQACVQCAHMICQAAVKYDIPLEINLNGMRYGKLPYQEGDAFPYPYRSFWEIAATYPIKVVFGYDAHTPTTLLEARRIDKAMDILEGLSFQYVDTFVIK